MFSDNYKKKIEDFQKEFNTLEFERNQLLEENVTIYQTLQAENNWLKTIKKKGINLHVYRNDSLVYWSTNQLPILRFSDIHFPSEGIIHLQNGWYYAKIKKVKGYLLCSSFLIKKDYSYENKDLKNEFIESLNLPFSTYITFEQENGFPIYSLEKQYLFSLHPNDYQIANSSESISLTLLLLAAIVLWFFVLVSINKKMSPKTDWIIPMLLIIVRYFSITQVWFGFMHVTDAFNPSLYGANSLFPNFFEFLLNVILITFLIFYLSRKIRSWKAEKHVSLVFTLLVSLLFLLWFFISSINQSLVENSSISLAIENLFSLSIYSSLAIASMGLLFYSFYSFLKEMIRHLVALFTKNKKIAVLFLGIAFLSFILQNDLQENTIINNLFPLILTGVILLFRYTRIRLNTFFFGVLILFFFSILQVFNLKHYNLVKEKSERILYANQLGTEKDVLTELEYASLSPQIKKDAFLSKVVNSPRHMGLSDFEDALERRLFNGFWERYEMTFDLYNTNRVSVISPTNSLTERYDELNEIIQQHGAVSEIDSSIFYIKDFTGHYSYVIKQPLFSEDSSYQLELIVTLKSKNIPEEIGFPRLLISTKAKVFEPLQNYSIAKYFHSQLVTKYGNYNYPTNYVALNNWEAVTTGFYMKDGYSHYLLKKSEDDVMVLSKKNYTSIELVTSMSYLFTFYGFLLIPYLVQSAIKDKKQKGFSLALKIQLVLISLVFLSLFAFGWGSGLFVNNQYNEYTNDLVREKLNSVGIELKEKLGNKNNLTIEEDGNYSEFLLQKLAKIFNTDINLYDKEGFLIASSRPKVFNVGLLSEQMNPSAYYQMEIRNRSEFIHQESIGKLSYSSAYSPFYSYDGKLVGYLNLQHFGQQKEFESKIQQFLVAIINVFMLLLAISIVIAIVVSNWVTTPLRIIQESFTKLKFGKHNQPIAYTKEDEIGALVRNYNQKLEELEFTASQLAQSERESAWREMAKQVAHEIKNPLTPMKLSLQHLMRSYDPNDPHSVERIQKVSTSIIEQIDALAKIANEFSSFAKLPRPNEKEINLIPILENVIEVFKDDRLFKLNFTYSLENAIILADKDLILRLLNNLIKNALQAIEGKNDGTVAINLVQKENNVLISIKDNGCGIPLEMHQKIFVPYFTTKSTGTGLGLAMVKQIVENHRGEISFESNDMGTTFQISFPLIHQ